MMFGSENFSSNKVMVVDDDLFFLSLMSRSLKDKGYVVHTCDKWHQVPMIISNFKPNLLMLDYNMPVIKGDKACSIIRKSELNPRMKIVIYSTDDSIVLKSVVEQCGADSFLGKNTSFDQLMDKVNTLLNEAETRKAEETSLCRKSQNIRKIMLVDQSSFARDMARKAVEQHFSCVSINAKDGQEALQILSDNPDVDFILLDVNVPFATSLQFFQSIAREKRLKDIPIIVTCSWDKEFDAMRGISLGAKDFIFKPFTGAKLCEVVESVWNKKLLELSTNN